MIGDIQILSPLKRLRKNKNNQSINVNPKNKFYAIFNFERKYHPKRYEFWQESMYNSSKSIPFLKI